MNNAIHSVNSLKEFLEIKETPSKKVFLINVNWLIPGKGMNEDFEYIHENYQDQFSFFQIDIDLGKEILLHEKISMFPAIMFFNGPNVLDILYGKVSIQTIEDKLNSLV